MHWQSNISVTTNQQNKMISFYPGPSRVYDKVPKYVKDAYKKGILSMNHRSQEFVDISGRTIELLKDKLNIPKNYSIFFTSSATECWEIIAQSVVVKRSYHIFNGAFGQKWFEYTKRINSGAKSFPFLINELINPNKLTINGEGGVICITQNETSNGTQVHNKTIQAIQQRNPNHLIAIDATSSMAGIILDFKVADIWFASVQKCFGLPAGLGLMVCSPRAVEQAREVGDHKYYNSLLFMDEMMQKLQTPFTPNVLNIYLLMRVLEEVPHIENTHAKTEKRYQHWQEFFRYRSSIRHLIDNEDAHSLTVIPVTAAEDLIGMIKAKAKKKDILLGEGYGALKPTTFRIANFPAIKKNEIKLLQEFLYKYE
jgi:phosphoserine aminotransferase